MRAERTDLPQGTLDLLVLQTLSLEPTHGWGLTQRIEQMSGQTFLINQGSLYPALERLRRKGWIRDEWRITSNNRRARYYLLTAQGRRQLGVARGSWERSVRAIDGILNWAGELP